MLHLIYCNSTYDVWCYITYKDSMANLKHQYYDLKSDM